MDFEVIGKVTVDDRGNVAIRGINDGLDQVEARARSVGSSFGNLGDIASHVWGGVILGGIQGVIGAAQNVWHSFQNLMSQGFEQIGTYERMSATMETLVAKEYMLSGAAENMTEALGAAGPKAEELLGWIQQLAIKSPFTQEGVATAFRTALAYGFTTEEAKRLTAAMLDFAAGSGATEETMGRISYALGQISATGKVTGGDMMQLINAGLPVVEILAKGFGKTTAEIMEMRQKGLLPAQESLEYITTYLETNFAGAGERQANTWAGLKGTFQDLKAMGLREFFGGIAQYMQPLAVDLSAFLQGGGIELLGALGDVIGKYASAVMNAPSNILNALSPIPIQDFMTKALEYIGRGTEKLTAFGLSFMEIGRAEGLDWVVRAGRAFLELQHAIDRGLPPLQAMQVVLLDLSREGGPLQSVAKFLHGLIDTFRQEGLLAAVDEFVSWITNRLADAINNWVDGGGAQGVSDKIIGFFNGLFTGEGIKTGLFGAIGNLLASIGNIFLNIDYAGILDSIDQAFANLVNRVDWAAVGDGIAAAIKSFFSGGAGDAIGDAMVTGVESSGSKFIPALGNALQTIVFAAFDVISWDEFFTKTDQAILDWLHELDLKFVEESQKLGKAMVDGLVNGLNQLDLNAQQWVDDHIINPIKEFLGIASPSTVFMEIGKNLVQGLIDGWLGAFDGLLSAITTGLEQIVSRVRNSNVGDVLQGLFGRFDLGTEPGTTGSRNTGREDSRTSTSTTRKDENGNIFNFYNEVHVGSWEELRDFLSCESGGKVSGRAGMVQPVRAGR